VSRFDADQEIIREYHRVLEGQQAFESRIREVGGIEEWWRQFRARADLHRQTQEKRNNETRGESP
jgi:hypothetical protein